MNTNAAPRWIDRDSELQGVLERLREAPWVAVDTEFLREKTYFPKLCLVQVAGPCGIDIVDPLACDAAGLLREMTKLPVPWVLHAARQDLEIVLSLTECLPKSIIDTQVAAPLLGYPDQVGYADLVRQVLGEQLKKGYARTDWTERPLSKAQIRYAADDVRHLGPLWERISAQLLAKGRMEWLLSEQVGLYDPDTYRAPAADAWTRVKGSGRLRAGEWSRMAALAAWREQRARDLDRPRGWLLADDLLVAIARLNPASDADLRQIRGVRDSFVEEFGEVVIAALGDTQQFSRQADTARPAALSLRQQALVDLLQGLVKLRTADAEINPALVVNRRELERFVSQREMPPRLRQGWRYELVGDLLERAVTGTLELSLNAGEVELR